jgi:hypothetical protein
MSKRRTYNLLKPDANEVIELGVRIAAELPCEYSVEAHFANEDADGELKYEQGFRDGLESFILALRDSDTLNDALTTTLEAYANNAL